MGRWRRLKLALSVAVPLSSVGVLLESHNRTFRWGEENGSCSELASQTGDLVGYVLGSQDRGNLQCNLVHVIFQNFLQLRDLDCPVSFRNTERSIESRIVQCHCNEHVNGIMKSVLQTEGQSNPDEDLPMKCQRIREILEQAIKGIAPHCLEDSLVDPSKVLPFCRETRKPKLEIPSDEPRKSETL